MSKLFQIHEDDLAELGAIVPSSARRYASLNGRLRAQLRRCQSILSNIRWNYGPPTDIEVIPVDEQPEG